MKIIKTANYKKAQFNSDNIETSGVLKDYQGREFYVDIYFRHYSQGDHGAGEGWDVHTVIDENKRKLSETEKDIYQDQLDQIISNFLENKEMNERAEAGDIEFDRMREGF